MGRRELKKRLVRTVEGKETDAILTSMLERTRSASWCHPGHDKAKREKEAGGWIFVPRPKTRPNAPVGHPESRSMAKDEGDAVPRTIDASLVASVEPVLGGWGLESGPISSLIRN